MGRAVAGSQSPGRGGVVHGTGRAGILPGMADVVLFEDAGFKNLLPLTYWRSVFELRIGRTIALDWIAQTLGRPIAGIWTRDWIADVASERCAAPANEKIKPGDVLVNGRWLPDDPIDFPGPPFVGRANGAVAFIVCDQRLAEQLTPTGLLLKRDLSDKLDNVPVSDVGGRMIRYLWDLVADLPNRLNAEWHNGEAAVEMDLDARVVVQAREKVHIGERTEVHPTATINASGGPVFISHDVSIGAGCVIDGPAYIGPGTRVNPHAWLHGANAIGPVCRVGGEIDGCIIMGYSNKQHDGFLGHAYVGSWVNLGAGSNNSDLKNTYGKIRVPINGVEVDTGLQFFGAIIGDHAKLGINATIGTGAVIGFSACAFTPRALPKFTPSFGWVTDAGLIDGDPMKLLDVADAVTKRRNVELSDAEIELFHNLPERAKLIESTAR